MIQHLTEDEKSRVRHHLGYLGVQAAQTFVLGVPAGVQTQFIIEGAMDRLMESHLPIVRRLLGVLDALEMQMVEDAELAAVDQLDVIKINQKEQSQLRDQYDYHRRSLANAFGVSPNPFDMRFGSGTGVNVPVSH